jgi:deoxyribodipyrimidine photo-lyase
MSSIFLFHRDLRLDDNKGLTAILSKYNNVIPMFILTPEQITNNTYKSDNAVQFMVECLKDLDRQLISIGSRLHILYGDTLSILHYYVANYNIKSIGFNRDYTPYSKVRDKSIYDYCQSKNIDVVMEEDYTTLSLNDVVTQKSTFYKVFTAFYNNHITKNPTRPHMLDISLKNNFSRVQTSSYQITESHLDTIYQKNSNVYTHGGRLNGLETLNKLKQIDYDKVKETPITNTTLLSAHIKFGTISIREVYYKGIDTYGKNSEFVRQIIWHDFYASLIDGLNTKDTIGGGNYRHMKINWENNEDWFRSWIQGKTGFPLIDAGIRQMNSTGWMHNQARMVVANFLTVILNIDWRWGEHYFATKLIDYDPASNNGNWQWSVQLGIDRPKIYPRIYNPWSYGQRKDPDASYIKMWIPELSNIPSSEIHNWYNNYQKYPGTYYKPIIDFEDRKNAAENRLRNAEKY